MKKSIFLFFAAILCAMTANAYNQEAKDLYFDNSEAKWNSCYVYIGHDTWTSCYPLTRVSGTQYLWKLAKADFNGGGSWNNAKGWVLCYEKWWDNNGENVYKFVYHGNNNVTNITTSAWSDSKIYKANGTQSVNHFSTDCTVYKVTSSTKSDYKVTINTVEGGTLTVKDYDDQAVASGASKIHLTVLKFSATPADGYVLDAVEINDGTNTTTIAAADLATTTHTLTSAITITPVWKAKDPLATEVYLAGEMNSWSSTANEFKKATAEATTASVTVTLAAQTYKFKLVVGGAWKGNTGTMTRGGNAVHEGGWSFDKDGYDDNCKIVADIAGDYTFTWNLETKKLTVTYPALPKHQVTATVNPAETGEVTGTGEYEQGSEATLIATPAAGYAFKNWTVGGTEKSTEATYTFTVSEPISLVANFIPEVTHEVTVSYICNSNPIPGHDAHTLAVGVTTPSTITAPAITNYTFNGWTLGSGVQAVDANANPIQITTKAEGEYTLTANYTKIELTYTVTVPEGTEKCYIAGDMNSWSFQKMTPTANANEFTITIDGATTAHKYKYTCGEGWAYVEKKADGSDLDADRTYNANDVVAKWAVVYTYYLMGVNNDWTTGIEMTENPDQEGEYMLTCQPVNGQVKIKRVGDDASEYWFGGKSLKEDPANLGTNTGADTDSDGNIELAAGKYNFYFDTKAEKQLWIAEATGCPVTVTVEDEFGTNTYTGVEKNGDVWSKEYNVGDEVTLNIASLDPDLVFAYWSVGAEKIFTEEYTFTASEDVTVTAVYALPMEVTFDNMALDTESWIVEAGPDAEYGVTVTLGIDVEGEEHPKGFGLVEGSSISIGEDELELVTGYFTDVDPNAPSAEAVIIAVYADELMAFVCTMSAAATPAIQVEVLDGVATPNDATGELWITGQWEGDDVYVQVPGFNGASFNCPEIWFYVGGTDFETASIIARGPATITVEDGDVSVEGTVTSGATSTDYELLIIGTLPAAPQTYTRTVTNKYGTICLPNAAASTTGAIFYRVAGKEEGKVYLESVDALEAGVPYIFEATAGTITVTYQGEAVDAPQNDDANGLVGTFTNETVVPEGAYILYNNAFRTTDDPMNPNKINANRAYLVMANIVGGAPQQMPGRRYISMDAKGENAATSLDNITNGENTVIKTIENGQLIIIRNGEKFNAQGVRF